MKKFRKTYKGVYKVINQDKYRGTTLPIYRSRWEMAFMRYCDINESVVWWQSEQPTVAYANPTTGTTWNYHPDIVLSVKNTDGSYKTIMVEIKPYRETIPPVTKKGKRKDTILYENKTWAVNQEKWKAAKEFCRRKGWEFKILTEKELFGK